MKTTVVIRKSSDLSEADKDSMWKLYAPHHNVTHEFFTDRLREFDRVALVLAKHTTQLVGFTGIRVKEFDLPDHGNVGTVCFGQTYILPGYRGQGTIQRAVTRLLFTERIRSPFTRWFFWSDALSYKPYLVMARNLSDYFPHPEKQTPAVTQALINVLGEHYYGDAFDRTTGTVIKSDVRLKSHVAPIGPDELRDPAIQFFAARNPQYIAGHGLIIVCPLSMHNLATYVQRVITQALRSQPKKHQRSGVRTVSALNVEQQPQPSDGAR